MWGEGSMWLLQAVFRHARRGLMCAPPCRHQMWCLGTGEGPDVLRKKVGPQHVGWRRCCRPFSGMRGGASCALHLAVDCIGCVVWGLEKALMCSERRWSRIQHVG